MGISSRAIAGLLDAVDNTAIEGHSVMVVVRGHVVAEGWWAPYSADRPHLLYSLTKPFTSIAVGLAIDDGLLSLDDRVVEILPEHTPPTVSSQARRLTVRHLLSMTAGHECDTLADAWEREPTDLVKGFLTAPFAATEGALHTYDNSTTFVLARMVEKVTGLGLPEYLEDRLFAPMGIEDAEWDRVASGAAFGFHGLHLRTEAVAAVGELLLRGGRWAGSQLLNAGWVESATTAQVDSRHYSAGETGVDFLSGFGYQLWRSRDGFHGHGAFGQHCIVVPSHDLVVVVTSAQQEVHQAQSVLDAVREVLLPGIGHPGSATDDDLLASRLDHLSLPPVDGSRGLDVPVAATLRSNPGASALPDGTAVTVEATEDGWQIDLGTVDAIAAGHGTWRESRPLGRPVCASGAWNDGVFTATLYLVTTPHHLELRVDAETGTASLTWNTIPLTTMDLLLHLTSPLMTRPDVS